MNLKEKKQEIYIIQKNQEDIREAYLTFSSCIFKIARVYGTNFTNENKKELISKGFTKINDDVLIIKPIELHT